MNNVPSVASGAAKVATEADIIKDEEGITNPNLHRRVDLQTPGDPAETSTRSYILGIYDDMHSIRHTDIHYHDEESTTSEIP